MFAYVSIGAALLVVGLSPWPGLALEADPDPVLECIQKNVPTRSSVQEIEILPRGVGAEADSASLHARVHWQRFDDGAVKAHTCFYEPDDLHGARIISIPEGNELALFAYRPTSRQWRRIQPASLSGPIYGTDISFDELVRLMGASGERVPKRLPDSVVQGRPTYVLETVWEHERESPYERIVSYVDLETCVPLQSEFYAHGGQLRKQANTTVDTIQKTGGLWAPRELAMRDLLEGTETVLRIGDLSIDGKVRSKLFTTGPRRRACEK